MAEPAIKMISTFRMVNAWVSKQATNAVTLTRLDTVAIVASRSNRSFPLAIWRKGEAKYVSS